VPLNVIQRQLGHANLRITSVYLEGIDKAEIIDTVHARRAPMIPASNWPAPILVTAATSAWQKPPEAHGGSAFAVRGGTFG